MSADLPPNQIPTSRWPVIGERDPEPFDPIPALENLESVIRKHFDERLPQRRFILDDKNRFLFHGYMKVKSSRFGDQSDLPFAFGHAARRQCNPERAAARMFDSIRSAARSRGGRESD